jgi:hypothetical protein
LTDFVSWLVNKTSQKKVQPHEVPDGEYSPHSVFHFALPSTLPSSTIMQSCLALHHGDGVEDAVKLKLSFTTF